MLLLKCKIWLSEVTSDSGIWSLQLEDLIHIWKFGLDHGKIISWFLKIVGKD